MTLLIPAQNRAETFLARLAAILLAALLQFCAMAQPAPASQPVIDIPAICETAAIQAAKATGVPLSVLKAISLSESGRKHQGRVRPWPWTVNMEGKGMWFDSRAEALAYATQNFDRGARSFDVGCFQINYKWHHKAFTSIDQMFDPLANALYAAEFLQSLYAEKGAWGAAAGAYHSRTVKYATRYQARFEEIRARFAAEDGLPLPEVSDTLLAAATDGVNAAVRREVIRVNTFPLLQGGDLGLMGSLVPQNAAAGLSLVAASGPASSLFGPRPSADVPDLSAEQALTLATGPEPPAPEAPLDPNSVNLGPLY